MPCEILWGHRFEQMQLYRKDNNRFEINFSAFHSSFEVATPTMSAKQLDRIMGSFIPPGSNTNPGSSSSQSYSLPSTLNRRRQIRRQQQTVLEDLNNLQVGFVCLLTNCTQSGEGQEVQFHCQN